MTVFSFRVVSHQLYGEPSYHMNICSVGVQYMRNNPEDLLKVTQRNHGHASYIPSHGNESILLGR